MRRAVVLLVLLCALAVTPMAAPAQSPFGPLPPAATPTPAPVQAPEDDQSDLGPALLAALAGGVLLLCVVIGMVIARDARRSLTQEDRRALERSERRPKQPAAERRRADRAKQRNRARTRAQKHARKQQRR